MNGARLFSDLIGQAHAACGDNAECIQAFYAERVSLLSAEEQKILADMLRRVAGFEEPQKPFENN